MVSYKVTSFICCLLFLAISCDVRESRRPVSETALIPSVDSLAAKYFGPDSSWYIDNVPFFECSDKQLESVYYYRWKLFKAHLRNTGRDKFVVTEFINHVPWDRDPWCTINAASMHHIYEGRWLRDDRYMNGYLDYLLGEGGNNRRYSESVADAAYARYLVNADSNFLVRHLDSMKSIYDAWQDHWDAVRNLYYIAAMPDATEYDIASIDASGGKAGFDGGIAFRPTINSYMFGNAKAIAHIARMKGDAVTAHAYSRRAADLKQRVQQDLWNPDLHHFTDRYKEQNQYVKNWDFIRGRELAGMAPWYFNLPDDDSKFAEAWKHVTDTTYLLGRHGLRTNEPSYQYYFTQFVFFQGKRGSQWNGPSWPYQTSQALTAMSNFLNDYKQKTIGPSDFVRLLQLYARQHYLPDGSINLVENYDPNLGGPIVYYYWSNHYNHSSFNNLIITGLCGLRPSEGDSLTVNPLVDDSIEYFRLQNVSYHGHTLTVIYDRNGARYNVGKGLTIFVDGVKAADNISTKDTSHGSVVHIGSPLKASAKQGEGKLSTEPGSGKEPQKQNEENHNGKPGKENDPLKAGQENYALNITRQGYPRPSSSLTEKADSSLYQAIDGRIWYFPEITNYWSTRSSTSRLDWLALDFGQDRQLTKVNLYLLEDQSTFGVPDSIAIEYLDGDQWKRVKIAGIEKTSGEKNGKERARMSLVGNTSNTIIVEPIFARMVRVLFYHSTRHVALTELECYQL